MSRGPAHLTGGLRSGVRPSPIITNVAAPVKHPGKTFGRWAGGFALSSLVAALARRAGVLRTTGSIGGAALGTLIMATGGTAWGTLLFAFFASASALTRMPGRTQDATGRTGRQVLSNGATAALAAALHARGIRRARSAFAGAVATAWADTWATEVGLRWGGAPRLLTTGGRVAPGSSGGVTPLGTAAGLLGALLCGAICGRLGIAPAFSTALAGSAGMLCDSLLGATIQLRYRCPVCGLEGERRRCACGAARARIRGLPWMDNDAVNACATAAGALLAAWAPGRPMRRTELTGSDRS